jgi:hypothetical protein
MLRLPNFQWRRAALTAHDLHHVITRYPCTMRGECLVTAWEFGAGTMPHWAATLFFLPLVLAGTLWSPRRMFRAFRHGRRTESLHGRTITDAMLDAPLVPTADAAAPGGRWTWTELRYFAGLLLGAAGIVLSPLTIAILFAILA